MSITQPFTVRRFVLTASILLVLALGILLVVLYLFTTGACGMPAALVEAVFGETPERKLRGYLNALAANDLEAALREWELPGTGERYQQLDARRYEMSRHLIDAGLDLSHYQVVHIEWWSTCCIPSVIAERKDAGGARLKVQFSDPAGHPAFFMFDIFVRDGPYWGAAAGYPPRRWVLRDVYFPEQEPLYWRWPAEGE